MWHKLQANCLRNGGGIGLVLSMVKLIDNGIGASKLCIIISKILNFICIKRT